MNTLAIRTPGWASLPLILFFFASARGVRAADYFLTIGGGAAPSSNQVSLERNAFLLQSLVAQQFRGSVRHDIYFADGESAGRDLQYKLPPEEVPRVNRLLAEVTGVTDELGFAYRSSEIPDQRGAATRQEVLAWFRDVGSQLQPSDRLYIYFTGHGGRALDPKQPRNTRLHLWNRESLDVIELARELEKLPAELPVVLVMVQCYSGGFADLIFNAADPGQGIAGHNRCGFFSTVHDRPAAGCTPDVEEENYQEYSSYFLAALTGQTRTGQPIASCDDDGDGRVSFAEAHAYALLTSPTIDISVCTSDVVLRAVSRTEEKGRDDLVTGREPYDQLLALASVVQRQVLEGLSQQLGLDEQARMAAAQKLAERLAQEKKDVEQQQAQQRKARASLRGRIHGRLTFRWPELVNRWNPQVATLLGEQSAEVVQMIEADVDFAGLTKVNDELKALEQRVLELDSQWARCQRLIRTLENVALAANLPKVADPQVQERYARLLAAEAACLPAPSASVAATAQP